jgi:DNA mismatch repair protein MSH6
MIKTRSEKSKTYYQTDELRDLITKLEDSEEELKNELLPFLRSLFKSFYDFKSQFTNTTSCIGELDCLCSLALVSSKKGMCRPKVLPVSKQAVLTIKKIRHPCLQAFFTKSTFIENDVEFGASPCLLITGPNMGGKSTLLR